MNVLLCLCCNNHRQDKSCYYIEGCLQFVEWYAYVDFAVETFYCVCGGLGYFIFWEIKLTISITNLREKLGIIKFKHKSISIIVF